MTTRVQKGGPVFRPVAKSRRPTASAPRQPSIPADSRNSQAPGDFLIEPAPPAPVDMGPMPPPPFIPIKPPTIAVQENTTKRRKEVISREGGEENDDAGDAGPVKKSRKSKAPSDSRKPRKSRGPSVPPFEPDADPGEEIDPTVTTMADICNDTGQGRVSTKAAQILENHVAWKAANREKRARMRLIMEQKKLGNDVDAEGDVALQSNAGEAPESTSVTTSAAGPSNALETTAPRSSPDAEDESGHGFDYNQNLSTSRFNVQVRIGPNGETIIDEESLFVDRNEENDDTENYTHVVESDTTKFTNSGTYTKKFHGSRWSPLETEEFYNALRQFGENYELISYLIPGRDRKACKNKFKAEDKKDPQRITYCLNHRLPVDIEHLSKVTGKDFSGPTPVIRVPTPVVMTELEAPPPPEARESTAPSIRKRSRSRSRNAGLDEASGEQIIGNVDVFEQDDG